MMVYRKHQLPSSPSIIIIDKRSCMPTTQKKIIMIMLVMLLLVAVGPAHGLRTNLHIRFEEPRYRMKGNNERIVSLSEKSVTNNQESSSSSSSSEISNNIKNEKKGNNYNVVRPPRHQSINNNLNTREEKERREMEWLVRNTSELLGPDAPKLGEMSQWSIDRTYALMKCWAKRATRPGSNAPHVVEKLLKRLIDERDAGNKFVIIDTGKYNTVLHAWSASREKGSAERAEEILLQMEKIYDSGNNLHVIPDETSYNAVIKAFVKNGSRRIAGKKAQEYIDRMIRLGQERREKTNGEQTLAPNTRGYNLLLYCLAQSNERNIASRAVQILEQMNESYRNGDKSCLPDLNSYNQVLVALARGREANFADKMQSVLDELLTQGKVHGIFPNSDIFNTVLGGYLKCKSYKVLKKMDDVLAIMEEHYENGNIVAIPDRVTINTMITAYGRYSGPGAVEKVLDFLTSMEKKYRIRPDTFSKNIVIDCWAKSGREDAPDQVLQILDYMEKQSRNGKNRLKPDAYTYSSVIDCFTKCDIEDLPEQAELVLKRMEDNYRNNGGVPIDTTVYNAVINAWAKSGRPEALQRAEAMLEKMESDHGEDPYVPPPDKMTYNTIIKVLTDGSAASAERAEQLLLRLEQRGKIDNTIAPDMYSYTAVITAFGKSNAENKDEKAIALLRRMMEASKNGNHHARPNVVSFNAALNACAFTKGDPDRCIEAFSVAIRVTESMKHFAEPNHATFGSLLRACSTLLAPTDERRIAMVENIFSKARDEGQVGQMVLTQLKYAASPDQYLRLVGRDSSERITVQDLPRSWTKNVKEFNRRP